MSYQEELQRLKIYGKQKTEKKVYHIPKVSAKRKLQIEDDKILFEQDKVFYKEIWLAVKHECQACKAKLPKEPLTLFFHHLLPKSVYPQFRHTPENIMVLCASCHSQIEMDADKVTGARKRQDEARRVLLPNGRSGL